MSERGDCQIEGTTNVTNWFDLIAIIVRPITAIMDAVDVFYNKDEYVETVSVYRDGCCDKSSADLLESNQP